MSTHEPSPKVAYVCELGAVQPKWCSFLRLFFIVPETWRDKTIHSFRIKIKEKSEEKNLNLHTYCSSRFLFCSDLIYTVCMQSFVEVHCISAALQGVLGICVKDKQYNNQNISNSSNSLHSLSIKCTGIQIWVNILLVCSLSSWFQAVLQHFYLQGHPEGFEGLTLCDLYYTSISLHFRGKYCTFYSTTSVWQLVTSYFAD